jgi:TetR/AcrR family transcriptional regulator
MRQAAKAPARRSRRRAASEARVVRRPQQRALDTRERLVDAAVDAFATHGFAGAGTREIARHAGVALAALPYHFTTKDALWRAAADRIFRGLADTTAKRLGGLDGVDLPTQLRLVLREFVRYSAAHPELHRFMMHEGFAGSARLAWLVETHVRPMYDFVCALARAAQRDGLAPPGRVAHLHYILIGAATSVYVLRAEYQLLTGDDPRREDLIDEHVATLERMFFGDAPSQQPAAVSPARSAAAATAISRRRAGTTARTTRRTTRAAR